jgi:hypothetical protein
MCVQSQSVCPQFWRGSVCAAGAPCFWPNPGFHIYRTWRASVIQFRERFTGVQWPFALAAIRLSSVTFPNSV